MLNFLLHIQQFANTKCQTLDNNFFGIPAWYKYLHKNGKIDADCTLSSTFVWADIWLILEAVIEMVLYVGGMIAIVMIMWGGFRFITSQGSPETIKAARETILYAIIGLIITISARVILNVVNGIF